MDFEIDYFLSPTNIITTKLNNLTPIPNTTSLIALNNLNDLILFNYNFKNTFKIAKSSNWVDKEVKYESFKLNERYLIAFNRIKSKLVGFNLEYLLNKSSFEKFEFEITCNNLTLYGPSRDGNSLFIVENKKFLSFYKCGDGRKKAEIPLYIETKRAECSEDFLILAMKDRRVISYFMADESRPDESYAKIRQLESRFVFFLRNF